MEDVSKALLIAAGVMLAVMLVSLLFIFGDKMASYFSEKHDAAMIEQTVEFNNKFQNYDGKTIRGNELVSIMNRVVDYNNYQSDMVGYDRIIIRIYLGSNIFVQDFKYKNESGGATLLSNTNPIITNATNDAYIKKIATTSSRLVDSNSSGITGLTDTKLQKLASNINYIVEDDEIITTPEGQQHRDEYVKYRSQLLTRILGSGNVHLDNTTWIQNVKNATYQYYQYTQFKRAMFTCDKIGYNQQNGRVNEMEFSVVIEDAHVKFD